MRHFDKLTADSLGSRRLELLRGIVADLPSDREDFTDHLDDETLCLSVRKKPRRIIVQSVFKDESIQLEEIQITKVFGPAPLARLVTVESIAPDFYEKIRPNAYDPLDTFDYLTKTLADHVYETTQAH